MARKLTAEGLTIQQEQFAQLVALGRNQAEAYREAYPRSKGWKATTLHECASRLSADRKVSARIQGLTDARRQRIDQEFGLTLNTWARQVARIGFADIRKIVDERGNLRPLQDLDDDTAQAIQGVKVSRLRTTVSGETREEETIIEYKLATKAPLLDQLGKFLGAFKKDNEQKADGAVATLLAYIAQRDPRVRVVSGLERRQDAEIVDVTPVPGQLLPKG